MAGLLDLLQTGQQQPQGGGLDIQKAIINALVGQQPTDLGRISVTGGQQLPMNLGASVGPTQRPQVPGAQSFGVGQGLPADIPIGGIQAILGGGQPSGTERPTSMDVGQKRADFTQNQSDVQKTEMEGEAKDKRSKRNKLLGEMLIKLGIPLATAGVGAAIPGALPGAAGFQSGYGQGLAGEQQRRIDAKDKEAQHVKDVTDMALTRARTKEAGRMKMTEKELAAAEEAWSKSHTWMQRHGKEYKDGLNTIRRTYIKQFIVPGDGGEERVRVISPEGVPGNIPVSKLEEYVGKRDFKLVR